MQNIYLSPTAVYPLKTAKKLVFFKGTPFFIALFTLMAMFSIVLPATLKAQSTTISSINTVISSPTNATSVNYAVTFGAAVTGVTASNFSLVTTGTISGATVGTPVTTDNITWTVPVNTGTGDGTITLQLANATGLTPGISTTLPFGTSAVTIDKTPPTFVSVTAGTPNTSPVAGPTIDYIVKFSEDVSDPYNGMGAIITGSVVLNEVSLTVLDRGLYRVTFTLGGTNAQGTLQLELNGALYPGRSVVDSAGNQLVGSPIYGDIYTVDMVSPIVSSVVMPADGNYTTGQTLNFTVNYNKNVTVTGSPYIGLTLNTGGTVQANYLSGSGTNALVFGYTVGAGDSDPDGITLAGAITANGGSLTDGAGHNANLTLYNPAATNGVLVNQVSNVAVNSITATSASPTNAASVSYTVTFGAAVTGLTANNFTLTTPGITGATVGTPTSTDNITWTVPVNTGTGDGTITLQLANATGLSPGISTTLPFGNSAVTIDKTAPTVSIGNPSVSSITPGAGSVTYTVTYADANFASSNLTAPYITVNTTSSAGATATVTGSGTSYTVTVSNITGAGTVGISIAAGRATDAAGNVAPVATSATFLVTPVTTTITSLNLAGNSNLTNGAIVYFTATFPVAVTGLNAANFSLSGAGASGASVGTPTTSDNLVWSVPVTTAVDGSLQITLANSNGISSSISNAPFAGKTYAIDKTPPTFVSVTASTPNTSPVAGPTVDYIVKFSEDVSGPSNGMGVFTTGSVVANGVSLTVLDRGLFRVTITLAGTNAQGTLQMVLDSAATPGHPVVDYAGNKLVGSPLYGDIYTVDMVSPIVSSVVMPADGNYTTGQTLNFTVNYNKNVTVTGSPYIGLTLNTGGTVHANYLSGSGTNALVFNYNVGAAVSDPDGITLASTITANGGTLTDGAGHNANLTLYNPAATNGVLVNKVSNVAVNSITATSASPTNAASVSYTITFGAAVTGLTANNFTLTTPGITGATVGMPTSTDNITWTVPVNTGSGDGTITLQLANATGLSQGISTTLPFGTSAVTIDKTAPTVTIGNPSATSITAGPGLIAYSVTYADINFSTSKLTASNISLNATGNASGTIGVTGFGESYIVTINSISGAGSLGITIAGGTATDAAGNAAPGATSSTFAVTAATTTVNIAISSGMTPTSSDIIGFKVTFGSAVTGLTASNFSLVTTGAVTGASVGTPISNDNIHWVVPINTGTGDGDITLQLANATGLTRGISTPLPFGTASVTVIRSLPVVVKAGSSFLSNNTNTAFAKPGDVVTLTIQLNAAILTPTVTIAGHSVTPTMVGDNLHWTASYTTTSSDVEGSIPFDMSYNNLTSSASGGVTQVGFGMSVVFDKTPPTISIGNPSVTSIAAGSGSVTYAVNYSDANFASSNLTTSNITLNTTGNATGTVGVTGSGTSYTVTLSNITGLGTIGFGITGGTALDGAGNAAPASTSATFAVTPTNTTINNMVVVGANPTGLNVSSFTVTFGSAVTGLTAGNFSLVTTGTIAGASIGTPTSTDNLNWTVPINTGTGDGNITLQLANVTGLSHGIGTALPFGTASVTVIKSSPNVVKAGSSFLSNNANTAFAKPGDVVTLTIQFNEAILTPTVTIAGHSVTATMVGDNLHWTASYTTTSSDVEGSIPFDMSYNNLTGSAGSEITQSGLGMSVIFEKTPPTITISAPSVNPIASGDLTFTITATGATTFLSLGAFIQVNTTNHVSYRGVGISVISANSSLVTIRGVVAGPGTIGITMLAGMAADAAGNLSQAVTSQAVTVLSDNPYLTGIALSAGSLNRGFDNGISTYSVEVPYTTSTIVVTPTPVDPNAAVTVNNADPSTAVALNPGVNTITITVLSSDGTANQSYTINVTRDKQPTTINSITTTTTSPAGASIINYTVTFGVPIAGLSASNFVVSSTGTVNGTSISAPTSADGGTTWTVPVNTGTGDGTIALQFANATGLAQSITTALPFNSPPITMDRTKPTVTISHPSVFSISSGAGSVTYMVTFADANFASSNLTASNIILNAIGSVTGNVSVSGSGLSYTVTISNATGSGILGITVAAGSATDKAGNQSAVSAASFYFSVLSTDATLSALTTTAGALNTAFNPNTITYGASVPAGTPSVTVTPTATISSSDLQVRVNGGAYQAMYSGDESQPLVLNAGDNTIDIQLTAQDKVTVKTYTLTVSEGKSAQTITFNPLPAKTYGNADFTISASSSNSGIPVTFSSSNPAVATVSGNTVHVVGAGMANIIASQTGNTDFAAAADVPQQLTVNKAALTITAGNVTKTYGTSIAGSSGSAAYSITGGSLKNGNTISSVTLTYGAGGAASRAAGTYVGAVIPSAAVGANGFLSSNYAIIYAKGDIIVETKALTITAVNHGKTYGSALPALTVKYKGFVNGDNATSLTTQPTISTTATPSSPIGTYPITASAAVDPNYDISYVAGTFTISTKLLTIIAVNQNKPYGSALPTLTVSYKGFVNGDNATNLTTQPTISTTATTSSPVGTYPITASAVADTNYNISYIAGTLTVGKAPLIITANNVNKPFATTLTGGPGSRAFTTNPGILPNGETISSVTIAYGGGSAGADAVGTYTGQVTPSTVIGDNGFRLSNYNITYIKGNIKVTQPTIATTGIYTALSTMQGTPSAPSSISIKASNMGAGILVTAPANFEVSMDNITYSNAITIGATGTIASTPVYVRLTATAATGSYSGNVVISSLGATTIHKAVPLSTVHPQLPLPTLQAQQVVFTSITTNSTTVSWTNGNGAGRVAFILLGSNGSAMPANGTLYAANTTFAQGTKIGATGWYCIYNGTGNSVNVTGLAAGTTYRVTVLEYNGTPGDAAYLSQNEPPGSPTFIQTRISPANVITQSAYPIAPARLITFSNTSDHSTTASWTNGDGNARAAFMELTGTGSPVLTDGTTYTASSAFGVGSVVAISGKPFYCIYNGTGNSVTITGLDPGTLYRVTVIEYKGTPGNEKYLNTGQSPANVTTGLAPINSLFIPKATGGQTPLVSSPINEKVEANNILSPNGDGINDIWVVKNIAFYPNNTVTVYNRAGGVVFTKKGYANDWDGSYRGSVLGEGTYYYLIELGDGKTEKGFITVVRER